MKNLMIEGIKEALINMGGKFIKMDENFVYVEIKKGSKLDNHSYQLRMRDFLLNTFNVGLKVKMV